MADYKETTVNGTSWQRAQMIHISNHLGQLPTVTYQEEEILALDTGNIQRLVGQISCTIDPESSIALRDLDTGEPTGETVPVGLIYQALYSDYLTRAFERDNPPAVEPETPVEQPVT